MRDFIRKLRTIAIENAPLAYNAPGIVESKTNTNGSKNNQKQTVEKYIPI